MGERRREGRGPRAGGRMPGPSQQREELVQMQVVLALGIQGEMRVASIR